jgi:DNA-directed RNA polymerase II subunit RPB1
VLGYKKVDFKRTVSNDIIEILETLGIEAARQSLMNEIRLVHNNSGIYMN